MNGYQRRKFEVRLGGAQVCIFLFVLVCTLIGSFIGGYHSGKGVGYELALNGVASNAPRIPVTVASNVSAVGRAGTENTEAESAFDLLADGRLGNEEEATSARARLNRTGVKVDRTDSADSSDPWEGFGDAARERDNDESEIASIGKNKKKVTVEDRLLRNIIPTEVTEEADTSAVEAEAKLKAERDRKAELEAEKAKALKLKEQRKQEEAAREKEAERREQEELKKEKEAQKRKQEEAKKREQAEGERIPFSGNAPSGAREVSAPKSVPTDAIPTGWYAQVAAPERLGVAQNLATKLGANGFPVVIEHARVRGTVYYRVLVGKKSTKAQASKMVSSLKGEQYLSSKPFVKFVK